MDKASLCKEIGDFFGRYFEEDGKVCIETEEDTFRYDSQDALLKDMVNTLYWHTIAGHGNPSCDWSEAVAFIYTEVIGKCPGVTQEETLTKGTRWKSYVHIPDGTLHGKNLHLGTYSSIVDAIFAREKVLHMLKQQKNQNLPVEKLVFKAKAISMAAKEAEKRKRAQKCPHCGKPLM